VVCAVAPVLNLVVPEGSVFHLSDYAVALVGKIMCYAICALAMDLIWGYTGILSAGPRPVLRARRLRHGHVPDAPDRPRRQLQERPARLHGVPGLEGTALALDLQRQLHATLILIVLVPGLVAFVFGYFAFRSRIKGVYFSIITQALTFAAMLLFFRNETGFRRQQRLHRLQAHPGPADHHAGMRMTLFVLTGLALLGFFCWRAGWCRSKFGRVLQAIRDAESRVMFIGYNPLAYKLTIWTSSRP
jgi:urea transport system permease protein